MLCQGCVQARSCSAEKQMPDTHKNAVHKQSTYRCEIHMQIACHCHILLTLHVLPFTLQLLRMMGQQGTKTQFSVSKAVQTELASTSFNLCIVLSLSLFQDTKTPRFGGYIGRESQSQIKFILEQGYDSVYKQLLQEQNQELSENVPFGSELQYSRLET